MSTIDNIAKYNMQGLACISATDCILFSLRIDDHFNRLAWLSGWAEGAWDEMHKMYPHFARAEWRRDPSWRID